MSSVSRTWLIVFLSGVEWAKFYSERGSRIIFRIESYLSGGLAWRKEQSPQCQTRSKPHLWITNRPSFLERRGWFHPVQTSLPFFGTGRHRRTANLHCTIGKLFTNISRNRFSLPCWCFTLASCSTVTPHVSKETPDSYFPHPLLTLDDIRPKAQEWIWSGANHWCIMGQTNVTCIFSIA